MSGAVADSAGLEKAFNLAMDLVNREVFGNRLTPVPRWIEPRRDATGRAIKLLVLVGLALSSPKHTSFASVR